jgi:hypothetical protein
MNENHELRYSGGKKLLKPVAAAQLRDEKVSLYPHAWVAIVQPDGSFEVSRLD